jgi:hypothetical protein
MNKRFACLLAVLLFAFLPGCESPPSKPAEQAKPAEPIKKEVSFYTGKQAFNATNSLAVRWMADAQPVRLESKLTTETNGQGGKATIWRAGFISPSKGMIKFFVYSGSRLPDSPPYGVSSDNEAPYSADVAQLAYPAALLKTDTDAAFDTAQQHGGANLLKKDPNQPIIYVLLWDPPKHSLYWHVVYGSDEKSTKGSGVINAVTGAWVGAAK